jgi:hypothetical protein
VTLVEQSGGQARASPADVTDAGAVGNALADIDQSAGPVDLLVNNAGILGPLGPLAHSRIEDWWRTIEGQPARPDPVCASGLARDDRAPPGPHRQRCERRRRHSCCRISPPP